jgi:hypothetical protein
MGRKPLEKEKMDQIILLSATDEKMKTIMEATGLTAPTIRHYQAQLKDEIDKKREELGREEPNTKGGYIKPPKELEEKEEKKEAKPKLPGIEIETAKKTVTKASASISDIKAKELTEDYKAAQMLHSAAVRYRNNIEMMGLSWEQFIMYAIDEAYTKAVDAYEEKVDEELRRVEMAEREIAEKLENPENGMAIEDDMMEDE